MATFTHTFLIGPSPSDRSESPSARFQPASTVSPTARTARAISDRLGEAPTSTRCASRAARGRAAALSASHSCPAAWPSSEGDRRRASARAAPRLSARSSASECSCQRSQRSGAGRRPRLPKAAGGKGRLETGSPHGRPPAVGRRPAPLPRPARPPRPTGPRRPPGRPFGRYTSDLRARCPTGAGPAPGASRLSAYGRSVRSLHRPERPRSGRYHRANRSSASPVRPRRAPSPRYDQPRASDVGETLSTVITWRAPSNHRPPRQPPSRFPASS